MTAELPLAEVPVPAKDAWRAKALRWTRAFLFFAGLGLAVWLVRSAGVANILAILSDTWRWVPLLALLEVLFVSTDIVAIRVLLGDSAGQIGLSQWVRSTSAAYASTILLPAGRAAGEATRATVLTPAVTAVRAIGASTRLQACFLAGNGVVSVFIVVAAALRVGGGDLVVPVLLNALACGALATALFSLLGSNRLASWLHRIAPRFAEAHQKSLGEAPSVSRLVRAASICVCGRLLQTLLYAVALRAVGGTVTVSGAFVTQGAHLVGAAVGDLVPGQVGVTEGAYRAFATTLGLAPARALSIALLVRITQLGLAMLCLLVFGVATLQGRAAEGRR